MNQATASPAAIEPDDACLLAEITLKFAGDSGDGIQLAGQQFAQLASAAGERVRTLPDFPAGSRASRCAPAANRCSPPATASTCWWR